MNAQIKKISLQCFPILAAVALFILFMPHAAHALEIQYPPSLPGFSGDPNAVLGGTPTFGAVFQFFFGLAIWTIGLLAFGSLLVFGFMYETSVSSLAKKLAAKMRFQGTLIGVFILLGFTIILRTINPELATLGDRTFQICPGGTCATVKVPSIGVTLTYTIDQYKNRDARLDSDHNKEQARYYAAFNLTPGIAPCSSLTSTQESGHACDLVPGNPPTCPSQGCSGAVDYSSIEFFQSQLPTVLSGAYDAYINPVFAVAVWRAGTYESQGNNPFGCITSDDTDVTHYKSFTDSFNCFKNSVTNSNYGGDAAGFIKWLSNYCDPTQKDPLICHDRTNFMKFLHQFYDNNAASGGSGLGLLPANNQYASKALLPPTDQASY